MSPRSPQISSWDGEEAKQHAFDVNHTPSDRRKSGATLAACSLSSQTTRPNFFKDHSLLPHYHPPAWVRRRKESKEKEEDEKEGLMQAKSWSATATSNPPPPSGLLAKSLSMSLSSGADLSLQSKLLLNRSKMLMQHHSTKWQDDPPLEGPLSASMTIASAGRKKTISASETDDRGSKKNAKSKLQVPCQVCRLQESALWCPQCAVPYCLRCYDTVLHHQGTPAKASAASPEPSQAGQGRKPRGMQATVTLRPAEPDSLREVEVDRPRRKCHQVSARGRIAKQQANQLAPPQTLCVSGHRQ